jgi:hypothetical protein
MERWNQSSIPEDVSQGDIRMNDSSELGQATGRTLTWSSLLFLTYRLYWQRFRTFFLIALPPILVAYLFKNVEHFLIQQLRHAGWFPSPSTLSGLASAFAITFLFGSVYWTISTLFFAAVFENVRQAGGVSQRLISDAYTAVRERIGALSLVGLLTWTLFQAARTIVGIPLSFFLTSLLRHLGRDRGIFLGVLMITLTWVVIVGLLCRFSLAVPLLMENASMKVREAVRVSVKKSDGCELFFMLFLAKSAILGYAIYWVAEYGFGQLWQRTSIGETLYYWLTWAFYICMAAMLESPLFIAFSILHRELKATPEDAMAAPAIG